MERSVLQIRIDKGLRYRFHMKCLRNHREMTDVLKEFIRNFVSKKERKNEGT